MADRSVLKALAILDALGASTDGKLLTEIARELGFPVSTVHRLLATLASRGYVQREEASGRFVLGSKILHLQAVTASRLNLARTAFPFLRKLVNEIGESANMSTFGEGRVVWLESLAADRAVGLYTPPGTIAAAHCTAMGKILLASLPDEELGHWLDTHVLDPFTPDSITDLMALQRCLVDVRERGYAVDHEEWASGVRCIAGPVKDHTGKVVAAVSVSAPSGRLGSERETAVIEIVKQICNEISVELGYDMRCSERVQRVVDKQR